MDVPQVMSTKNATTGEMGQGYLATGKQVAMRCWEEAPCDFGVDRCRDYETVGFVVSGSFELDLDGQTVKLEAGDSWLVPAGAKHRYRILESLMAIEATSPPARFSDRVEEVG